MRGVQISLYFLCVLLVLLLVSLCVHCAHYRRSFVHIAWNSTSMTTQQRIASNGCVCAALSSMCDSCITMCFFILFVRLTWTDVLSCSNSIEWTCVRVLLFSIGRFLFRSSSQPSATHVCATTYIPANSKWDVRDRRLNAKLVWGPCVCGGGGAEVQRCCAHTRASVVPK